MLTAYFTVSVIIFLWFIIANIVDIQISKVSVNYTTPNSKEFSLQIVMSVILSLLWPLLFIIMFISCFIPRKSYPHQNLYQ